MAERLLVRSFDERCNDDPKDIMAALLTPQPAGEPAALLGLASATQPSSSAAASTNYAAFVGDAGRQVCSCAVVWPFSQLLHHNGLCSITRVMLHLALQWYLRIRLQL